MLAKRTEETKIILTKTIQNIKQVHGDRPPRSHRPPGVSGIALAYHPTYCIPVSFLPTSLTGQAGLDIHAVQIEALDFCAARFRASSCFPLFSRGIQVLLSLPEKGGGVYNVLI